MPRPVVLALLLLVACGPDAPTTVPPETGGAAQADPAPAAIDVLALHDELERKIADESAKASDRKAAYDQASASRDDGSAGYAFARAALAGRLAENRGAKAGKLVTEAERFARKSIERDPQFRGGAATRLLATLYVLAPPRLVEHGDSEVGLEMLEKLVADNPDDPRAQLRLAEAYIALGDPDPAMDPLCRAIAGREGLPADEQRLLDRLIVDAGGTEVVQCDGAA